MSFTKLESVSDKKSYHWERACRFVISVSPVSEVDGRLLVHDAGQLNRRKKYFTTFFDRITSGEFPLLVDDSTSHLKIRIQTVPSK